VANPGIIEAERSTCMDAEHDVRMTLMVSISGSSDELRLYDIYGRI
jgi:hypothetical protein